MRFLTLAISETRENEFSVIAMNMEDQSIIPLKLSRNEIMNDDGEVFWDIGMETSVSKISLINDGRTNEQNKTYHPTGCKLISGLNPDLKSILEDNLSDSSTYLKRIGETFAILKVKKIEDIITGTDKRGKKTTRLVVTFADNPKGDSKELLNKDNRWRSFWLRVPEAKMDEQKVRYLKLLNKRGKNVYVIMYRHYYKFGPIYWIVGMHWL